MTLATFEKQLKSATSLTDITKALEKYLLSHGITTFAFTYYSYHPASQNKLKYEYSTPNYTRWHKHYISESYEDIDTTLASVYQTSLPTFWNLQQQLKDVKSPREKRMRLDSIAYGITQGLCIPIHGPQEDFAVLLLVQMRNQHCLEDWEERQYEFLSAAYYYYFYLQRQLLHEHKPQQKNRLSKREHQCLMLIAKQYSIATIANMLKITERTANFHIQNLNKKLGTKNKHQSVNKALQKGLISL